MRRIAVSFLAGLAVLVHGCHNARPQAEPLATEEADYGSLQPDLYVTDAGTTAPYIEPAPAESTSVIYSPVAESPDPVALTASSGVTHVVVKGDTLYRLAREYYGDQSRWKEIYEANRDVLSDPHRLRVGQKLIIP